MIKIERILCPTDLTPESDGAVLYALALARAYDGKLFILHSTSLPEVVGAASPEEIVRMMADAVDQYGGTNGHRNSNWRGIVAEGDPINTIPDIAAKERVDLIVMRSRRRPHAAALLGSTAEAVCRTAPCPVLITHLREREWVGLRRGEIKIRRVLAAHDFSLDSEVALGHALSLAQEYQAELHICHVLPSRPSGAMWFHADPGEAFHQVTRRLAASVPPEVHSWSKVVQVVREGQPFREILDYAEKNDVDLICMGVHGAGFGLRTLFGSNVDRVLRQAPCPVLVARPLKPALPQRPELNN